MDRRSALEVVRPGPLALVQDAGRPGFASMGVSPSGAADRGSYAFANRLVGNPVGAAALELVLGGLVVRARGSVLVALTGAPAPGAVNGRVVDHGVRVYLRDGDVLELGTPASGLRTYLAVAGGIDVPAVLGSRSTDVLAGLGLPPIAAGDLLPIGESSGLVGLAAVSAASFGESPGVDVALGADPGAAVAFGADPGACVVLGEDPGVAVAFGVGGWAASLRGPASVSTPRSAGGRAPHEVGGRPGRRTPAASVGRWTPRPAGVADGALSLPFLPGPRADWLADVDALTRTEWVVDAASDRIGVRLDGPPLDRAAEWQGVELSSEGLVRGSVQLPPDGRPVVFGADHPVTGGYPVIAVLTEAAGDVLAQARPGTAIRFVRRR